jgi:hypothetical protein
MPFVCALSCPRVDGNLGYTRPDGGHGAKAGSKVTAENTNDRVVSKMGIFRQLTVASRD